MMEKVTQMIAMLIKAWKKESVSQIDTPPVPATPEPKQQSPNNSACLTERVNTFLQTHYDFRYNRLTEETEFRPLSGAKTEFRPIGKRELNTLCMEAHAEGISCWDKDVSRYIYSTQIGEYHPFRLYMDELPPWDGIDRLTPLARRVSALPLWVKGFHTWMLGLAAQWEGKTGVHANSLAPILISAEQGRMKSTFCKSLMPKVLQRYYMDNLKLTSEGQAERLLSEMGLINLDEFDKYAESKMPLLKNLMQMSSLHVCKAYQRNFRDLPRIASFIGTSNRSDLMSDPTGSRRFFCVEVEKPIDSTRFQSEPFCASIDKNGGRTEAYGIWECIFGGKTMNFTYIILSYIMCLYHQILRITHRPSLRPPSRESIPFSVRDSISRLIVRSVTFVFWDISEIVIVPSACMNSSIIC